MIYKKDVIAKGKLKARASNGEGASLDFLRSYYQKNIKTLFNEEDYSTMINDYGVNENILNSISNIEGIVEIATTNKDVRAYLSDYYEIQKPFTTEFNDDANFSCYELPKNKYIVFDNSPEYACALSYVGDKVLDLNFFVDCTDQGMENTDDNPLYFHGNHPLNDLDLTILSAFIEYGLAKVIATQGTGYRPEQFPPMKMERGIVICADKNYLITTNSARTAFSITGTDIEEITVTDADISGQDLRHIFGEDMGLLTLLEKSNHSTLIKVAEKVRENISASSAQ